MNMNTYREWAVSNLLLHLYFNYIQILNIWDNIWRILEMLHIIFFK